MSDQEVLSLQDHYAPKNSCFGCGPSNKDGLRIKSILKGDVVVAHWAPEKMYEAFPGVLSGGIIGTLLDCHSNWTAAWHLMQLSGADSPPCTVTADYSVKLLRPTPTNSPIEMTATLTDSKADRATIQATLTAQGKICATCVGTFVAVKPGHPAYHRW